MELVDLNATSQVDTSENDAAIEKVNRLPSPKAKATGLQDNDEAELIDILGEDKLASIGESIVEIVRQNDLHKSPCICKKLFRYLSNVIVGWNSV